MTESAAEIRSCRVCWCTDDDCSGCIEFTGGPCHWISPDLCSACEYSIRINVTTEALAKEIAMGRVRAHRKHGENSIESVPAFDARWLPILVEEVGEAGHALTYDALGRVDVHSGEPLTPAQNLRRTREQLRAELIDVATVAIAWLAAIDREPTT